jgi:O-acetyl-ADP-ribose deacetylase (regulator of RNase III)
MIESQQGNILQADAEALVNTVNCVGVMGRGVALQFRKEFPENYKLYKAVCAKQEVQPGKMLVFDLNRFENPRWVINFPTKVHWKGKSRIEHICTGLVALVEEVQKRNIQSIAIPPLGCGLGGLNWADVRPLIERAFQPFPDVRVLLFDPTGAPAAEEMPKAEKAPHLTVGRASLLGLMRQYLAAVMTPSVSLLEIHKLMYFMQEAGESLKLNYTKAQYGPYAKNLRHVLNLLEGHYIRGYGDAEDTPEKQIELNIDAEQIDGFLQSHPANQERFQRVVDLIDGFETPYGMELLATVHWVTKYEKAKDVQDVINKVYAWNEHKSIFKKSHIQLAWNLLQQKGWHEKVEASVQSLPWVMPSTKHPNQ